MTGLQATAEEIDLLLHWPTVTESAVLLPPWKPTSLAKPGGAQNHIVASPIICQTYCHQLWNFILKILRETRQCHREYLTSNHSWSLVPILVQSRPQSNHLVKIDKIGEN